MGPEGRDEDLKYICFCEDPPDFNKGATLLMFTYFIENILRQVAIFCFLKIFFGKDFRAS